MDTYLRNREASAARRDAMSAMLSLVRPSFTQLHRVSSWSSIIRRRACTPQVQAQVHMIIEHIIEHIHMVEHIDFQYYQYLQ